MSYDLKKFNQKAELVKDWLAKELSGVRTGRATSAILDNVVAEVYGAKMPIKQLAGISNEDPRTLRITPYDNQALKPIEKALTLANLGLSVSADSRGIRVGFPELTGERREILIKSAKEKTEKGRISLRQAREEIWKEIQDLEKTGTLTEDEKFTLKDKLQKEIDKYNSELEESLQKKITEIQN